MGNGDAADATTCGFKLGSDTDREGGPCPVTLKWRHHQPMRGPPSSDTPCGRTSTNGVVARGYRNHPLPPATNEGGGGHESTRLPLANEGGAAHAGQPGARHLAAVRGSKVPTAAPSRRQPMSERPPAAPNESAAPPCGPFGDKVAPPEAQ